MDSTSVRDLQSTGQEQYAAGDYRAAVESFRELTANNPTLADNWRLRGFAEHACQDFIAASDSFSRAVHLDPRSPESYFGLGSALMGHGSWDSAVQALDEALVIRPDHAYAKRALIDALTHRASQHFANGTDFQGESDLDRAIKLDRKNSATVMALVQHFEATGQQSRAAKTIQLALADISSDPQLQAAANRLNVKAPTTAVVDAQRREQVRQSQEVPCPVCKKMVMNWASVCPYCNSVIKQVPSQFAGRDTGPAFTWQEVAYKIMAFVWMLAGVWTIVQGALLTRKEGYLPGMEASSVIFGVVYVGVGIGLLTESEVMQFIAKVFCLLVFVGNGFGMMFGGALNKVFLVTALIEMTLAGFQLYLLREVAGD